MNKTMTISSSPHIRDERTTGSIMLDVIIALLPTSIMGIYNFGYRAFLIIAVSILASVASEWIYEYFMHKKITTLDFSAVVTGLLLALNLPSTVPIWMPILGSIFAIIIVKQLFGGIGQNFMNPALAARCFLLISFTGKMTNFTYDAITTATPLALLKSGENVDILRMFIGSTAGTIGETSAAAILIGAVYMLLKNVIRLHIPLTYLCSFSICILIYLIGAGKGLDISYLVAQLCGGGIMLGAFFMATDYTTSPITDKGKILFGILLGVVTFVFRSPWKTSGSTEGVSYAIVFCNLLVPLIERITMPKSFGKGAKKHE